MGDEESVFFCDLFSIFSRGMTAVSSASARKRREHQPLTETKTISPRQENKYSSPGQRIFLSPPRGKQAEIKTFISALKRLIATRPTVVEEAESCLVNNSAHFRPWELYADDSDVPIHQPSGSNIAMGRRSVCMQGHDAPFCQEHFHFISAARALRVPTSRRVT